MCAYSSFAEVRPLVGNILDTEFDDTNITTECDAADSWIKTKTQKSDWDASDVQWKLIIKIANKKAAEYVLEHYGSEYAEKVKDLRLECDALIKDVIDNLPADEAEGLDSNILVDSTDYQSYPLNLQDDPDALPYLSTEVSYTI
jgi:hypothetical protein